MAKKEELHNDIVWRAAEHDYSERGPLWYFLIGFSAIILIIISFWQKNFFFAVFVVLASITLMFLGRLRPQIFEFRLEKDGVRIGEKIFYDYDHLEGFAVVSKVDRLDEIVLKKKATLNPYLKLPADSKTAARAKEFLAQKLPEFNYEESLVDIFSDLLGF
jgi:hypothetical protein